MNVQATDASTVLANAGGVGVAVGLAQSGVGAAVAFGISAASNTISNQVLAYLDDATVTAMGNVSVIATEDASIECSRWRSRRRRQQCCASGVGVGAAGAGSGNTISDDTEAYTPTTASSRQPAGNNNQSLPSLSA